MAIKTQFLGGGSNLKLKVYVDTGSVVTITQGDIAKNGTSVNGVATFSVTAGTWQVKAVLNGQESTTEVNVVDEYEVTMTYGQPISELSQGAKLKIDGHKFILQAINPTDYPNCYTLISEETVGESAFSTAGSVLYENSTISNFCNGFYNELSSKVKEHIVASSCFAHYVVPNQFVFPPSSKQLNYYDMGGNGNNLGFSDNASRAIGTQYWTVSRGNGQNLVLTIVENGSPANNGVGETHGVRVLMNFNETALFSSIDSEGYYEFIS